MDDFLKKPTPPALAVTSRGPTGPNSSLAPLSPSVSLVTAFQKDQVPWVGSECRQSHDVDFQLGRGVEGFLRAKMLTHRMGLSTGASLCASGVVGNG